MARKSGTQRPPDHAGARPARPGAAPGPRRPGAPRAAGAPPAGPPPAWRRWLRPLAGRHGVPIALLVVLHLGLYQDVVFGGDLLLGSGTDVLSALIPYRTGAAERLLSGELPLWDPGHFAGAPLLANGQSGATYPPYWLFLGLSPGRAVSWSFVFHVLLASLATYALAWRLRRGSRPPDEGDPDAALPARARPLAAAGPFVAATLVSLGGGVQAHVFAGHVNLVEAFAWLPAVLLALDVVLERPGPVPAAALGLVFGVQLLAGHPQVSFLTALAALVWAAVLLLRRPLRRRLAGFGWAAAGAAVGVLVAGLLLVPLAELGADSHRQLVRDAWDFATEFAAAPLTLLQVALAHPFGAPGGDGFPWWAQFGRWEPQGWVGAPALLLAVVGVAALPDRRRLALAGLTVAALVLALGDATPLYRAFATVVPGATLFRVPARFLLLAGLTLPLLAGLGVDALVALRAPRRLRAALLSGAVLLLLPLGALRGLAADTGPESTAAAWGAAHGAPAVTEAIERGGGEAARARERVQAPLAAATDDALLWLVVVAGLGAAVAFVPRRRAGTAGGLPLPALLGAAIALVMTGHAARFAGAWIVPGADPRPPLTDALLATVRATAGPDRAVWWEDRRWNVGLVVDDVRNVGGYDPAITWRLNDVLNLRRGAAADEIPRHKLWMLWPPPRAARPGPAWDLLAGRAVVTRDAARAARLPGLLPVADAAATGSPYAVFENRRAFPRAGVSYGAIVEPDPAARLALLSRPDHDPRRALVFDEAQPPLAAPPVQELPQGGSVTWEADEPERVVLVAETDRAAYLWLADTWRPGWEARVDDVPAPLLRANHAFRAVALPAGRHRVELLYRPLSVGLGAGLTLLGTLLAGALLWWPRRKAAASAPAEAL